MENITLSNDCLALRFVIDEDGKVRLAEYGDINRPISIASDIISSRFVEVDAAGFDHLGHHGVKASGSSFGENATYSSHSLSEIEGKKDLTIVTGDRHFEVKTHFIVYPSSSSFSVYNEVKNIGDSTQTLTSVSSLFLYGFDEGMKAKELKLGYANNGWHLEAQWNFFSFEELGIFADKGATGPKRWHLGNVGSWSTKEYLPMISIENDKGTLLAEIESNVSWNIEVGGEGEKRYLFLGGPTATDGSWTKDLAPEETFISPSATISFGNFFEDALSSLTIARRNMRDKKEDDEKMPVIFNSYMHALWDLQTEESLKPLIDAASKAGAEIFCIDAGWFASNSNWWGDIGDYEEEKSNFPSGGLIKTLDYIRKKGMKVGLWIEIENVGEGSSLWKKAPKSWFLSINGHPLYSHGRHFLDFTNPEVFSFANKTIDRLMGLYHLDYIKIDYNVDCGVGSDKNSSSLGEGLLNNGRAVLSFYEGIQKRYPGLTLENCASGGGRMDYLTLKHFPIQSTSDQTDFRLYPYIAGNVLTACPPEQAAVWAYPFDSTRKVEDITDEDVALNMVNALLGRIHLASFIGSLDEPKQSLISEGVKAYKATRDIKKEALPIYPMGLAHFGDEEVIAGLSSANNIILALWNTSGKPCKTNVNLKKYGIKELHLLYPTSLKTSFSFDDSTGILNLDCPYPYFGRAFIGTR